MALYETDLHVSPLATVAGKPTTSDRVQARRGDRLAFRLDVAPDEEVLWAGAREEVFSMRSSSAVLLADRSGTHVVVAEVYGPDRRLRDAFTVEIEVS